MQQIDKARQTLAAIGYQINSIGATGKLDPLPIKQAIQSLTNALTALVSAVDEIDRRTQK